MKRRVFFSSAASAAALTGLPGCSGDVKESKQITPPDELVTTNGRLGGKTLEELRGRYHADLFDDYIPFLYKYVVDREYGGFMCTTDRDGTNLDTNKRAWFEGRGTWVSSFLYNKLDPDPEHLEVAKKSVEFVLQLLPKDPDSFFPMGMTREGKPLTWTSDVYGDLFVATGLQEYSRAVKDDSYWQLAKELMLKCLRLYDRPDYGKSVNGSKAMATLGQRYLGHWMIFIRLCSQMLADRDDPEVQAVIDRCLEAILDHHLNPEFGMMNEELPHDMVRKDGEPYNSISLGHGTETLWMVFYEALRRGDRALYERAAKVFKRQVEVAWDDVYGGAFMSLTVGDDQMCYGTSKSLWLQEEVLIGTMFMVEHFGDEWAKHWYEKVYTYVLDKFPLKQYGYPIWILYADQKVTFEEHTNRVGNFHHPRHLMLNLLSIDRMIERGGKISNKLM